MMKSIARMYGPVIALYACRPAAPAAAAQDLGDRFAYAWAALRGPGVIGRFSHHARTNIDSTHPYYISSCAFVVPKAKNHDIASTDSPALRGLGIGYGAETSRPISTDVR